MPLAVKSSSHTLSKQRPSDETNEEFVSRLTHLYMQEKNIHAIKDLSLCSRLQVLYLHDNCISKMENLHGLDNLQQLFLHGNKIEKMENLDQLPNLRKLYLGQNAIGVLEGFGQNSNLQELHIERQRLAPGEKLLFDPRSMKALAHTLELLNISHNGVDTLQDVGVLYSLHTLVATNNQLMQLSDVTDSLRNNTLLKTLQLTGNPVCKEPHYLKDIVTEVRSIDLLDGKEITPTSKVFLQHLEQHKRSTSRLQVTSSTKSRKSTSRTNYGQVGKAFVYEAPDECRIRMTRSAQPSFYGAGEMSTGNEQQQKNLRRQSFKFTSKDSLGARSLPELKTRENPHEYDMASAHSVSSVN